MTWFGCLWRLSFLFCFQVVLKHCTLADKAEGVIWRDLSKPPQRAQGPDPRLIWLLVGTPLVLGPELAYGRAEHCLLWRMSLYIFDILFYHLTCLCNTFYDLSALVGCWSSAFIRKTIYIFLNVCRFEYTAFAVSGEVGIPYTGLTTPFGGYRYPNWPSEVGPQSLCNRRFWWRLCVVTLLFGFFSRCRGFVIKLSQISSFSLYMFWCISEYNVHEIKCFYMFLGNSELRQRTKVRLPGNVFTRSP